MKALPRPPLSPLLRPQSSDSRYARGTDNGPTFECGFVIVESLEAFCPHREVAHTQKSALEVGQKSVKSVKKPEWHQRLYALTWWSTGEKAAMKRFTAEDNRNASVCKAAEWQCLWML